MSSPTTWVLERNIFSSSDDEFVQAVRSSGGRVVKWDDDWWNSQRFPDLEGKPVVFRGCLSNAARVGEELPWKPGAYCDVAAFNCSSWYPSVKTWLLHESWVKTTVGQLVDNPEGVLADLGSPASFLCDPIAR
jgi:hypothetical protein